MLPLYLSNLSFMPHFISLYITHASQLGIIYLKICIVFKRDDLEELGWELVWSKAVVISPTIEFSPTVCECDYSVQLERWLGKKHRPIMNHFPKNYNLEKKYLHILFYFIIIFKNKINNPRIHLDDTYVSVPSQNTYTLPLCI